MTKCCLDFVQKFIIAHKLTFNKSKYITILRKIKIPKQYFYMIFNNPVRALLYWLFRFIFCVFEKYVYHIPKPLIRYADQHGNRYWKFLKFKLHDKKTEIKNIITLFLNALNIFVSKSKRYFHKLTKILWLKQHSLVSHISGSPVGSAKIWLSFPRLKSRNPQGSIRLWRLSGRVCFQVNSRLMQMIDRIQF